MLPNDTIKIQLRKGREKKSHTVVETSMLKKLGTAEAHSRNVSSTKCQVFPATNAVFPIVFRGKETRLKDDGRPRSVR